MKTPALFALCGIALSLSGCLGIGTPPLSRSDLIGSYKDNNPLAVSTLTLRSDGTFSQMLTAKWGKKYTATGQWTFDTKDSRLELDDLICYDDMDSLRRPKLYRRGGNYPVEKTIPEGTLQIVVDGDKGVAFEKR